MRKIDVTGGWVEFNGFRVAKKVDSVPASVWSDFLTYVERGDADAYSLGRKEGYDEGFREGLDAQDVDCVARLR